MVICFRDRRVKKNILNILVNSDLLYDRYKAVAFTDPTQTFGGSDKRTMHYRVRE